jgi:hypothetical protein
MPPKYSPVRVIVIPSTAGPVILTFLTEGEAASYMDYINSVLEIQNLDRKRMMPSSWIPYSV